MLLKKDRAATASNQEWIKMPWHNQACFINGRRFAAFSKILPLSNSILTFTALHSANKFLNEQQIFGLNCQGENDWCSCWLEIWMKIILSSQQKFPLVGENDMCSASSFRTLWVLSEAWNFYERRVFISRVWNPCISFFRGSALIKLWVNGNQILCVRFSSSIF